MALDRRTGKTVWRRTAYEGVPKEKRHIKATYANATPFTDGRYVVAFFGSQGLYAFDMNGRPSWKKDLGVLNTGAYDLPEYEWGTASSPIIYKRPGDRAVRHAERVVRDGVGREDREDRVEDASARSCRRGARRRCSSRRAAARPSS